MSRNKANARRESFWLFSLLFVANKVSCLYLSEVLNSLRIVLISWSVAPSKGILSFLAIFVLMVGRWVSCKIEKICWLFLRYTCLLLISLSINSWVLYMTLSRIFSIAFLMLWVIIYFILCVFLRNVKNTIIYSSIETPFVIAVISDSNAL